MQFSARFTISNIQELYFQYPWVKRRGSSLTWQRLNSVPFIHVKSTVVTTWRTVFILGPVLGTDLTHGPKFAKKTTKTKKLFPAEIQLNYPLPTE